MKGCVTECLQIWRIIKLACHAGDNTRSCSAGCKLDWKCRRVVNVFFKKRWKVVIEDYKWLQQIVFCPSKFEWRKVKKRFTVRVILQKDRPKGRQTCHQLRWANIGNCRCFREITNDFLLVFVGQQQTLKTINRKTCEVDENRHVDEKITVKIDEQTCPIKRRAINLILLTMAKIEIWLNWNWSPKHILIKTSRNVQACSHKYKAKNMQMMNNSFWKSTMGLYIKVGVISGHDS